MKKIKHKTLQTVAQDHKFVSAQKSTFGKDGWTEGKMDGRTDGQSGRIQGNDSFKFHRLFHWNDFQLAFVEK